MIIIALVIIIIIIVYSISTNIYTPIQGSGSNNITKSSKTKPLPSDSTPPPSTEPNQPDTTVTKDSIDSSFVFMSSAILSLSSPVTSLNKFKSIRSSIISKNPLLKKLSQKALAKTIIRLSSKVSKFFNIISGPIFILDVISITLDAINIRQLNIIPTSDMEAMRDDIEKTIDNEFKDNDIDNVLSPFIFDDKIEEKFFGSMIEDVLESVKKLLQDPNTIDVHPLARDIVKTKTEQDASILLDRIEDYKIRNVEYFSKKYNYNITKLKKPINGYEYIPTYNNNQCKDIRTDEIFTIYKDSKCKMSSPTIYNFCRDNNLSYNESTRICDITKEQCESNGMKYSNGRCIYDAGSVASEFFIGKNLFSILTEFFEGKKCPPYLDSSVDSKCRDDLCIGDSMYIMSVGDKLKDNQIIYTNNYYYYMEQGYMYCYRMSDDKLIAKNRIGVVSGDGDYQLEVHKRELRLNKGSKRAFTKTHTISSTAIDEGTMLIFTNSGAVYFILWYMDTSSLHVKKGVRKVHKLIDSEYRFTDLYSKQNFGVCYKSKDDLLVSPDGRILDTKKCPDNYKLDSRGQCSARNRDHYYYSSRKECEDSFIGECEEITATVFFIPTATYYVPKSIKNYKQSSITDAWYPTKPCPSGHLTLQAPGEFDPNPVMRCSTKMTNSKAKVFKALFSK